jgi:hypothetical protein
MPPLLDTENDILYVDDIDKCNLLNSFFLFPFLNNDITLANFQWSGKVEVCME